MKRKISLLLTSILLLNFPVNLAYSTANYSICTIRDFNNTDLKLCNAILNGENVYQQNTYSQLQIQSVVRHLYDLYNSNWHDKNIFDKKRTDITFSFINKFGNGYDDKTERFDDTYYKNLFTLVSNTNDKTYDIFKDFLLRNDTTIENLPTILHLKKLNKYLELNKNDFETLLYIINDKKLPDKQLNAQSSDNIYKLMTQEYARKNMHELGIKYSKLYFDDVIYHKLKNKIALSENNINTFIYLSSLYKLSNYEEDFLTRIITAAPDIDTNKIERIILNVLETEYLTDIAINHIIKTDDIGYLTSQHNFTEINEYAKTRLEYDDMFILKESEYVHFLYHPMEKTKVIAMLKPILSNPYIKDKYAYAKAEIDKTHEKETYKKEIIDCFKNPNEHIANILAPNANNMAVFVGMLNPINLIATVALSPMILLFWPIKSLK